MNKSTILIIVFLLIGCAPVPDKDDNHGYGYEYDFITLEGVRVRNNSETYVSSELIDSYYQQLISCTGFDGADILIIFQDTDIRDYPGNAGLAYFDTGLAIIRVGSPNPDYVFEPIIKHEMLHLFLSENGLSDTKNIDHGHEFFQICR